MINFLLGFITWNLTTVDIFLLRLLILNYQRKFMETCQLLTDGFIHIKQEAETLVCYLLV